MLDGSGAGFHSAGIGTIRDLGVRSRKAANTDAPLTPSMMAWCTLATSAVRPPSSPSTTCISHSGRSGSSWRLMTTATNASSSALPPGEGRLARLKWSSSSKSGSSTHTGWCSPRGTRRARWRNGVIWCSRCSNDPADLGVAGGRREQRPRSLGRVKDEHDAHMHGRRRRLEREEGGVHSGERLHQHLFIAGLGLRPSRAGMPEAAPAPFRLAQAAFRHEREGSLLDPDQHELGDAVASADRVVALRVVVHQHDPELAPVARVDQAPGR